MNKKNKKPKNNRQIFKDRRLANRDNQGLLDNVKIENSLKQTSSLNPSASALKFFTVLGTTFPNNPISILPILSSPIFMSKYT